jgi:predicted peptidase
MSSDQDVWDGPCRYCIDSSLLPCAVFCPLVGRGHGGFRSQFEDIWAKVDELAARFPLDLDRVYVTGVSMGGTSTWEMAWTYPGRIAGIAPVCGSASRERDGPKHAARLAELGMPAWIFHGDRDWIVYWSDAQAMHDAMTDADALEIASQRRLSLVPGADHYNIVSYAYPGPELYSWLTSHSLRTRKAGSGRQAVLDVGQQN